MDDEQVVALQRGVRNGIEASSQWEQADFLPDNLGSAAQLMLGTGAAAFIAGAEEERAPQIVTKAHAWLLDSTARDERVGEHPVFFAMTRARALGLSAWLLGEESVEAFGQAVRLHQQYLAGHRPAQPDLLEDHLRSLVRDCLAADRPALGAEVYRRLVGTPPIASAEVGTPLELAGWLCERLSGWHQPADGVHVGERVLGPRLLDDLAVGQALEVALWLKLVYADSGAALTATEALRRGGQLIGAQPVDPLARLLLDSLGDPVDLDLFTGFLAAVVAQALPGASAQMLLEDASDVIVPPTAMEHGEGTPELDRAIAAALSAPWAGELSERLAAAVRGRLVAVDGETLVTLRKIRIG